MNLNFEQTIDICHLYDYARQARIGAEEYERENHENIKKVMLNSSRFTIWTKDGNVHHFMGYERYYTWSKGRIYMLSDGTMMRGGYPIEEYEKEIQNERKRIISGNT